jgi:MFS superfamily sulfate permease-like transporter
MPTVSAPGECPLLFPNTWKSDLGSGFLVFLIAVPLGLLFDLEHEHRYHLFHVGPKFLIRLPGSLSRSIAFPDFLVIFRAISIEYIIMDSLVGSIESLLSVSAVDSLDPEKKSSDRNWDLLATGNRQRRQIASL